MPLSSLEKQGKIRSYRTWRRFLTTHKPSYVEVKFIFLNFGELEGIKRRMWMNFFLYFVFQRQEWVQLIFYDITFLYSFPSFFPFPFFPRFLSVSFFFLWYLQTSTSANLFFYWIFKNTINCLQNNTFFPAQKATFFWISSFMSHREYSYFAYHSSARTHFFTSTCVVSENLVLFGIQVYYVVTMSENEVREICVRKRKNFLGSILNVYLHSQTDD